MERDGKLCKNRMDQCALQGSDVTLRHIYKTSAYLQASERVAKCQQQLCSAGTDFCAKGAEEEHDGYQYCFYHVTCVMYINPQCTSKQASGKMSVTTVLEQICAIEEMKKSMTVTSN